MKSKRGQGLPMNVIIIAIIVLVVLIVLIAFFAGGFSSIVGKVRALFGGGVSAQAQDLAISTCQQSCETAKKLPTSAQAQSSYCKLTFLIDHDADPDTIPQKYNCGRDARQVTTSTDETERGIVPGGDLGISCSVRCT
ncbi:hypothetical protein J4216_06695 [Candidatus Woesearchaeota archaeon]|nr:hypothetical protein [Candidatus Woesearchaeota archaeon]